MSAEANMRRVLVVEDDPDIRKLVGSILKSLPRVEVVAASDARAAIKLLETDDRFSLVCLDLMLPESSGLELCEHIRKAKSQAELPILIASSRTLPLDRAHAIEAGANAYLTKPFRKADFLQQVRKLLGD